jgi:phosphoserine phosphatase RsbU/P
MDIHEAICALEIDEIFISAVLATWDAATSTVTWLRCGHPPPMVWHRERGLRALEGGDGPVLGLSRLVPRQEPAGATIAADELLVLVTDGILERITPGAAPFGDEGLLRALNTIEERSASAAVAAVLDAVGVVDESPLRDDASVLVLAPTT